MRRLLFVFALIMSFAATGAQAAGKITVDPNTPEAAAAREQKESFWDSDERLAQKVTFEARRKTVSSILTDLSKSTGVTFKAGYNSMDWQVRDRKMLISARDLPLKDLMQSIARVMKFKWSRSESQPYTYRLFMDRKTLLETEGQAYRAEQQFNEQQKKNRENVLNKFAEVAGASQEELQKLKSEDPYLYHMASTGIAGALSSVMKDTPIMHDCFVNGQDKDHKVGDFPEGSKKAVASLIRTLNKYHMSMGANNKVPSNLDDKVADAWIESYNPAKGLNSLAQQTFLGVLELRCADFGGMIFILNTDGPYGKLAGKSTADWLEGRKQHLSSDEEIKLEDSKVTDFGEAKVKHENDPDLNTEIDFASVSSSTQIKFKNPWDFMLTLSKASGMNIVSDDIGVEPSLEMPLKVTLQTALNNNSLYNFNWWKRGNVLEFRDRYWFKKRSLQIPEEYLERWRKIFKETKTLGLDDLAEMAVQTGDRDKYTINITGDEVLDTPSVERALADLQHLRFYSTFSREQRDAILSKDGLSLDLFTQKQLDEFNKYHSADDSAEVLLIRPEKIGSETYYYAYTHVPDFNKPQTLAHTWYLATPRYEAPK